MQTAVPVYDMHVCIYSPTAYLVLSTIKNMLQFGIVDQLQNRELN